MPFALIIVLIVLLAFGISLGELRWSHVGLCLLVAVAAFVVIVTFRWPFTIFYSLLAVMEIVLVLVIFKGDIQI